MNCLLSTPRILGLLAVALQAVAPGAVHGSPLPAGTTALSDEADWSEAMRAGIERYLDRELVEAAKRRESFWRRDLSSAERYAASLAETRARFARQIGAIDERVPNPEPEFLGSTGGPSERGRSDAFTAHAVRWPVYPGVYAEGLLLQPAGVPRARVVALPDADQTPEMIAGLDHSIPDSAHYARQLAANGCQVLIPTLVSRGAEFSAAPHLNRATNQPHREWIYRQAYTFGRHVIGYEVHMIAAAVDWFARQNQSGQPAPIGVIGWGEGGLLALYSAALDPRIEAALVSGYFGPREALWDEPIYRNVFGLLREFGDAEIASMVAPRVLIIEPAESPQVPGPPAAKPGMRACAAPGRMVTPSPAAVAAEVGRARQLAGPFGRSIQLTPPPAPGSAPPGSRALLSFVQSLVPPMTALEPASAVRADPIGDRNGRQQRQVRQLETHTQKLVASSRTVREEFFWKPLKLSTPEAWDRAVQPLREQFWSEIMGRLPRSTGPLKVRSRELYRRPESTGHEVVIDVLPDVALWGYLLLPNDLAPGERRPVVVAQHGLNGLPADLLNEDPATRTHRVYKAFAAQLVKRGYVVFVPHFPWRAQDDYRRLQRKANPLGLSVFSFILAHHTRLLDWLVDQPYVDARRIGLYGLSWGGKVAMRVPALEPRYALSICSGDFNEWIWKNATTDWGSSYIFAPEPDMFDFRLGLAFGHGEMAAMIAPRPFMVERGHGDGVGTDEMVAFEYSKVRRLYNKLRIPQQTEIEFFDGVHEINGVGTFNFLERQFNWRPRK